MRLVLDAGALIAIERGDRKVAGLIAIARRAEGQLITTAPVVAQAWRDGARQVNLVRAIDLIDVRGVSLAEAKDAGRLLGEARTADVVDALVALLALPGDQVLTSDPDDLAALLAHRPGPVTVVGV